MHHLVWELQRLAEANRDASYVTQANRRHMLTLFAEQLLAAGFRHMHAHELKGRHVEALVRVWTQQGMAAGTLKNRLSVLRWWAQKVNRASVIHRSNDAYGIPKRQYVARASKAQPLPVDQLVRVRDRYVRMSLELQRAFGLRREEALKIKPFQADRGQVLVLQPSWTKGGRGREVPIQTLAQREVLDRAKALVKRRSAALIPPSKTYAEQLHRYEWETRRAGLSKMHGLRHAYAQDRYLELTGFPCPAMGGPMRAQLTPEQVELDSEARAIISDELGHGREQITAAYLGR